MHIETFVDGAVITLDTEAAAALTAVLARVADNTVCESVDTLYNLLVDNFYEDASDTYNFDVEENPDYNPNDEDDFKYVLRLTDKDFS